MSSAESSSAGMSGVVTLVSAFVERYRLPLLVVAGAVVAALGVWLIWAERERSVEESSALRAEQMQDLFESWNGAPEGTRKTNLGNDLIEEAELLLRQFPRRYAAQRALYVRAEYWFATEQWQSAIADWQELAARWPTSYLAPLSIFNAAVALEEAGDAEAARAHLERLVADWEDNLLVPRALFSIGRMAEQRADYDAAREAYARVTDDHGGSSWATAVRNRLIALETQGLLPAE